MKAVLAEKKQFIVYASGHPVGVLLDLPSYERLCEAVQENNDLQAYGAAKARTGAEMARKEFATLDAYRSKRAPKRK